MNEELNYLFWGKFVKKRFQFFCLVGVFLSGVVYSREEVEVNWDLSDTTAISKLQNPNAVCPHRDGSGHTTLLYENQLDGNYANTLFEVTGSQKIKQSATSG